MMYPFTFRIINYNPIESRELAGYEFYTSSYSVNPDFPESQINLYLAKKLVGELRCLRELSSFNVLEALDIKTIGHLVNLYKKQALLTYIPGNLHSSGIPYITEVKNVYPWEDGSVINAK